MKRAVLVCVLFAISMAIQETAQSQGTLFTEDLSRDLMQSKIGRAIIKLASLRSKTQQVDFGRLFSAIDDLEESLKERKTDENASFDQDYQQYISDYGFYQNQVTEYTEEVAKHEVDLEELTEARFEFQATLRQKSAELGQAQRDRDGLQRTQAQEAKDFEAQVQKFDSALVAVDEASELVQKVYDGPQNGRSFIEVTPEQINGAGQILKNHVEKLANQEVFGPLVEVLLTMTQKHFADQKNVRTVIDLLIKFRASLAESKAAAIGTYQSNKEAQDAIIDLYNDQVDTLQNEVIPNIQDAIETKNAQIDTKNALNKASQENLQTAQENFDATESNWVSRQDQHKSLVENWDHELSLLSQAEAALTRGGIKRT